jgi:hypothetical protein
VRFAAAGVQLPGQISGDGPERDNLHMRECAVADGASYWGPPSCHPLNTPSACPSERASLAAGRTQAARYMITPSSRVSYHSGIRAFRGCCGLYPARLQSLAAHRSRGAARPGMKRHWRM